MNRTTLSRFSLGVASVLAIWLAWSGYSWWREHYARVDFPKIDRHPELQRRSVQPLGYIPRFNPASRQVHQVDLRTRDVAALDLKSTLPNLAYATFDTATRWPATDRMPPDYDPARVMELGRNPGLGVRRLHAQGITGRGVGVAVIDQILPTRHPEYGDRLRLYEETDDISWIANKTEMHGPAVASLAVGRTVGVAPGADLYYIGTHDGRTLPRMLWHRWRAKPDEPAPLDFAVLARAVRRVLTVNRQLPADRKIRVVAIAIGWPPGARGYDEITAASAEARAAGLFVICSSVEQVHGFKFQGLGRAPTADPDDFSNYEPGLFWARDFRPRPDRLKGRLLVPMDSRTTAGCTREADYVFFREGGWSWSIPYLAGAYALAAQVKPAITPDEFWALALKTGRTIDLKQDDKTIAFGPIIDPVALIDALRAIK